MKKNKVKTKGVANKDELEKKYVYLTYTEYREGGGAEDPDDRWSSRTDENVDWGLIDCRFTQEKWPNYTEQVEIGFDVNLGETVYVVYVRYGTGDSFGHTDGAWKIIDVYQHQEEASAIVSSINNGTYNKGSYNCWDGYFESLQSCDYQPMIVKA